MRTEGPARWILCHLPQSGGSVWICLQGLQVDGHARGKECWLARIDTGRFPFSAVAFLNCRMGPHIPEAGWLVTGNDVSRLRFLEFQSTKLEGKPLDTAKRHSAARHLTAEQAKDLLDPNRVLAARDLWKIVPEQ